MSVSTARNYLRGDIAFWGSVGNMHSLIQGEETPYWILFELAKVEELSVKLAARKRINNLDILTEASSSEETSIRQAVAEFPDLPELVLEVLKNDTDIEVKKTLAQNKNLPSKYVNWLIYNNPELHELIWNHPQISPDAHLWMCVHGSVESQRLMANSWKLSNEAYRLLGLSSDDETLQNLELNKESRIRN